VAESKKPESSGSHTNNRRGILKKCAVRLVYGLSLRVPDDVQKPFSFCGAKFLRNHSRSGHNHVLGRLYHCTRTFASVQNFEHGKGMLGDLVMVRIGSHGVGSLRRVDNIVTGLRRYTNRQLLALSLTKKGFQPGFRPRLPLK